MRTLLVFQQQQQKKFNPLVKLIRVSDPGCILIISANSPDTTE